ncbi:MAG: S-layer homology domain-containing protein [Clostridiales bacterium]|nr:S-layer homology domain-containing protein [Clostridiales bacterium]
MKKKMILLLMLLLLFCLTAPALAVNDPAFSVRVNGVLEESNLTLDWQIMANRTGLTLNNTQGLRLAYDNRVLKLIRWDANGDYDSIVSTSVSAMSRAGNRGDYDSDALIVYGAKNAMGNTGFLSLTVGDSGTTYTCPQGKYISLIKVRFAFREGKSNTDLNSGSIRIMTLDELSFTNQDSAVLINTNENHGTSYKYLSRNSVDSLNAPEFDYPGSTKKEQDPVDKGQDPTDKGQDPTDKGQDPTDKGQDPTDKGQDPTDKGQGSDPAKQDPQSISNDNPTITDNPTLTGSTLIFKDVLADAWFFEAIKYVMENGFMNGISSSQFSPNIPMTRAMFATVLYRMDGEPATTVKNSFTDVKQDQWYTAAINWANDKGFITGYGGGKFGTNDNITREQVVVILHRYSEQQGKNIKTEADLSKYVDAGKISSWAKNAMQWAVGSGLISGRTVATLAPQGEITRAEIAQILFRY